MANLTLAQALEVAISHHDAGRLRKAESMYRRILQHEPANAEALRMLGLLAHQVGRYEDAETLIRQALAIQPRPDYFSNLGVVLAARKKLDDAIGAFQQALAMQPNDPQTLTNLASALVETRQFDRAIAIYRQVIASQPNLVEAHYNLGKALQESGDAAGAADAYRKATSLQPRHADAWNNLGTALKHLNRPAEAIAAYQQALIARSDFAEAQNNFGAALSQSGNAIAAIDAYQRAIALRGEFPEAQNNLGNTLERLGRSHEAADAYRTALAVKSDFPEAYNNLGNVLLETSRLDEAIECYRKAIALRPDYADALNNLGNALKTSGRVDAALDAYRRAASLSADSRVAGNLLYFLHFHPTFGPREIYDAHLAWNDRFAAQVPRLSHANDRDPDRRLRIGYVSPDLRENPVGRFMLPLMRQHDHTSFEIHCYTDTITSDPLAEALRSHAAAWHVTAGLSDEQLAERIRADGIDVLVDLTMHLKGSRLMAFARKPAPVQITYLAYCSTTGLAAMDYRFTDSRLDPQKSPTVYTEQSIRLRNYWCYAPLDSPSRTSASSVESYAGPPPLRSPGVPGEGVVSEHLAHPGPSPAETVGHVAFGCLNSFSKTNPPLLAMWAKILVSVPGSRLILHADEGSHRRETLDLFARHGVDASRIAFNGFQPMDRYLAQYQQIDIALDPFPYAGGTTTCDALWMGVPVVSRTGSTAVSRGGASLLSNVGLSDLVADSEAAYVRIAIELASDRERLAELRRTLRPRMQASPLMDEVGFARDVETQYRNLWRRWVAQKQERTGRKQPG